MWLSSRALLPTRTAYQPMIQAMNKASEASRQIIIRATDAVFSEFFDPDVFVALQRISGDPGMDPNLTMELRVEFTKTGRNGTLVRIIQGPYDKAVASDHSKGWELELDRLAAYLDRTARS